MDPLQPPLHRQLGRGLDHAAVEGDHVVALDPHDAEAEVGCAGVDPHHDLHGMILGAALGCLPPRRRLRRPSFSQHVLVRDVEVGEDFVDVVLLVERVEQLQQPLGVVALRPRPCFSARSRSSPTRSRPRPPPAPRARRVRSLGSQRTRSWSPSSRTSSAPASIAAIRSSSP